MLHPKCWFWSVISIPSKEAFRYDDDDDGDEEEEDAGRPAC